MVITFITLNFDKWLIFVGHGSFFSLFFRKFNRRLNDGALSGHFKDHKVFADLTVVGRHHWKRWWKLWKPPSEPPGNPLGTPLGTSWEPPENLLGTCWEPLGHPWNFQSWNFLATKKTMWGSQSFSKSRIKLVDLANSCFLPPSFVLDIICADSVVHEHCPPLDLVTCTGCPQPRAC